MTASVGGVVKFSLGTPDEIVAKVRHSMAAAQVEQWFEALRTGPSSLSRRQIVGLSGEVYRLHVDRFAENPGDPATWAAYRGAKQPFKMLSRAAGMVKTFAFIWQRRVTLFADTE